MSARRLLLNAIVQASVVEGPAPPALVIDPSSFGANYGEFDPPQDINFDALVSFGEGPYTYVWDFINVNNSPGYVGEPAIISGQGTATVTVRFSGNTDATLRCTVTDNLLEEQTATSILLVHFGAIP